MIRVGRNMVVVSAALGAALAGGQAEAARFTLEDLGTTIEIETDRNTAPLSVAGLVEWNIPGDNVVYEEAFWYGSDLDGEETAVASEPITFEQTSDTNGNPGDDVLDVQYTRAGILQIDVRYTLQGGPVSTVTEEVTLTNISGTILSLNFYAYSDFDIGGIDADVASFDGVDTFTVVDPGFGYEVVTVVDPAPDRWEIALFQSTQIKLDDGDPDDLSNAASPFGPGDVTWTAQWDFILGAGQSASFRIEKQVAQLVPVPASAALLGLGLVTLTRVRRRAA